MAETRRGRGSGAAESAARRATPSSERRSLPVQTFPPSHKLNERVATAFRTILGQERRQADQNDEPQSIFLTKLLPANRISAETPTSAPPMMQNICRQIAEGIASWVTPWTSA